MSRTSRLGWTAVILLLYMLHQDLPFWRAARPLVLGFLPVGLAYHAVYCLAVSVLMWALARWNWPSQIERPFDLSPPEHSDAAGSAISEPDAR